MRKIITLLFFALSFSMLNAQKNADLSLEYLKVQQNKAIENENYEAAAKYKKAITLKSGIKEAVADEDWDKAAELKKELNDINFKSGSSSNSDNDGYYSNNGGLREESDREFMEGGFFIDGMLGAGMINVLNSNIFSTGKYSSAPNVALGFQMGTKWHFGEGNVYRPGLQMTWLRFGIQKSISTTDFSFHLYPVNIGYASIFGFTDEIGLEVNINFGGGLNFLLDEFPIEYDIQLGVHVNPNVKFRYNALAVGFDVSLLNGPVLTGNNNTWGSSNMYSITFGGKF